MCAFVKNCFDIIFSFITWHGVLEESCHLKPKYYKMKTNAVFFKGLLLILFLTTNSFYQNVFGQSQSELVIQLNQFNFDKQLNDFKNIISDFKAVKYTGCCNHLNSVFLKVDRILQPDDAKFLEALKHANFVFELKTNTTIAQVQSACRDSKPSLNDVH
jgi:hypothetical protein